MAIEFDPAKSEQNRKQRGVGFELAERFVAYAVVEDDRRDYGETRYRVFGMIDGRPYALVYTPRNGRMRIISLRRMHAKEAKLYGIA